MIDLERFRKYLEKNKRRVTTGFFVAIGLLGIFVDQSTQAVRADISPIQPPGSPAFETAKKNTPTPTPSPTASLTSTPTLPPFPTRTGTPTPPTPPVPFTETPRSTPIVTPIGTIIWYDYLPFLQRSETTPTPQSTPGTPTPPTPPAEKSPTPPTPPATPTSTPPTLPPTYTSTLVPP